MIYAPPLSTTVRLIPRIVIHFIYIFLTQGLTYPLSHQISKPLSVNEIQSKYQHFTQPEIMMIITITEVEKKINIS